MKVFIIKDLKTGEWYDNTGYYTKDITNVRFYSKERYAKATRTRENNYQIRWHDNPDNRRKLVILSTNLDFGDACESQEFQIAVSAEALSPGNDSSEAALFLVKESTVYLAMAKVLEVLKVSGVKRIEACENWVGLQSGNNYGFEIVSKGATYIGV